MFLKAYPAENYLYGLLLRITQVYNKKIRSDA